MNGECGQLQKNPIGVVFGREREARYKKVCAKHAAKTT